MRHDRQAPYPAAYALAASGEDTTMTNDPLTFGARLRALRKLRRVSQTELANDLNARYGDRIRISQTTVSAWEHLDTPPKRAVIDVLAEYFGLLPDYFDPRPTERIKAALAYLEQLRTAERWTDDNRAVEREPWRSPRAVGVAQGRYDDDEFLDT